MLNDIISIFNELGIKYKNTSSYCDSIEISYNLYTLELKLSTYDISMYIKFKLNDTQLFDFEYIDTYKKLSYENNKEFINKLLNKYDNFSYEGIKLAYREHMKLYHKREALKYFTYLSLDEELKKEFFDEMKEAIINPDNNEYTINYFLDHIQAKNFIIKEQQETINKLERSLNETIGNIKEK